MAPELAVVLVGSLIGLVILSEPVTRTLRALIAVALFVLLAVLVVRFPIPFGPIGASITILIPLVIAHMAERSVSSLPGADWDYHALIRRVRNDMSRSGPDLADKLMLSQRAIDETPTPAPAWIPVRTEMQHQLELVRQSVAGESQSRRLDALTSRRTLMSAWREAIRVRGRFVR